VIKLPLEGRLQTVIKVVRTLSQERKKKRREIAASDNDDVHH
jgi:hypothetical protein